MKAKKLKAILAAAPDDYEIWLDIFQNDKRGMAVDTAKIDDDSKKFILAVNVTIYDGPCEREHLDD